MRLPLISYLMRYESAFVLLLVYRFFPNELEFWNKNDEPELCFVVQVVVAAAERSLDPVPLDQPILDKLVQAKLAKT